MLTLDDLPDKPQTITLDDLPDKPSRLNIDDLPDKPKQDNSLRDLLSEDVANERGASQLKTPSISAAGERYPAGIMKSIEDLQKGAPSNPLMDIFTPNPDQRNATQIAQDIGKRVLPSADIKDPHDKVEYLKTVGTEFIKNLPFTTAGAMSELANPTNALIGGAVATTPHVNIPAPQWLDNTIAGIIKNFGAPFSTLNEAAKSSLKSSITDTIFEKVKPRMDELKQNFKDINGRSATDEDIKSAIRDKLDGNDQNVIHLVRQLASVKGMEPVPGSLAEAPKGVAGPEAPQEGQQPVVPPETQPPVQQQTGLPPVPDVDALKLKILAPLQDHAAKVEEAIKNAHQDLSQSEAAEVIDAFTAESGNLQYDEQGTPIENSGEQAPAVPAGPEASANGITDQIKSLGLSKSGFVNYAKTKNLDLQGKTPEVFYDENIKKGGLSSESGQAILPIDTIAKATKEIVNLVSPTTMVPKPALDTAFKMKGDREKVEFQLENQMLDMEKAFEKMPKTAQVSFIDNIKRGLKQPTPAHQAVADIMRQIEDAYWAEAKKYKPSLAYLDNHYRVLWKIIPGKAAVQAKAGFKGLFRRPLQGSKGFIKQHTLADMSEGLALGGEPHSYNPVTMWRNGIMDMQKFITAQRMFKTMKDMGYVKFVKFGGRAPDGFVKLNDSIAKIYFPTDPGMVNAGEFYVEENTGRILNNFLSKDWIKDSTIGGSLLKFKNLTTAIELSLSPFHASYVSLAAMASDVGLGLQKMVNRGLIQHNGEAFLHGLASVGTVGAAGPAKFVSAGAAMIKYVSKDSFKHSKAGQDFLKKFPNADELIDDLFQGGGKLAIHQDYKINSLKAFKEGIKNKEPWAVTISALPAANELIMKPLFEIYIPRIKIGAFLYEMSNELVQRQAELASGKLTRAELARNTWMSIENRFGEMNFDNLFWDRTFKSALQLVFRSVTWKVGALKNISGGIVDQFVEIKHAIDQNRAPLLNRNTAYLMGIAVLIAAFAEITMQLFLKKSPENLKDVLAPQYDKEGNRISLNTHMKDWIHLAHSPLKFIQNSMSGEIGRMISVWQNKDFYNTQIFNPKDPWLKQAMDKAKYLFPTPFSISNQKKLKGDEAPGILKGMVAAGVAQPAPGYISQTEAQQKAAEINSNKPQVTKTKSQKDHADFKRQLMIDVENTGKYGSLNEAFKSRKINEKEYNQIRSDVKKNPLERSVSHMTFDEVASVMEKASPEELKMLKPIFIQKVNTKIFSAPTKNDVQYLKQLKEETLKRFK